MTAPEGSDPPPLVEQDMSPDGKWVPCLNAFMTWEPAEGNNEARGPINPQVHDAGAWYPAAGNAMKWIPWVEPVDAPSGPVVPIVSGDEPQPGDEDG